MSKHATPSRTGVGLRLPHLAEVVATRPNAAWLEIHPENFLANPHATELLLQLAADYPISVHTVGVSIGSVGGIDTGHLRRVRTLVDVIDPMLVSGHLAWSTHEGDYQCPGVIRRLSTANTKDGRRKLGLGHVWVEYDDGTEASTSQMAKDVTVFLNWAAEPEYIYMAPYMWRLNNVLIHVLIKVLIHISIAS